MKIKGKIEDSLLLSLYMEDGQPQMFSSGLAVEAGLFPDGRFSSPAPADLFDEVGTAQMEGVLAVFTAQAVRGFIETPEFFGLQGVFEEGILNRCVVNQIEEDDPCGPVQFPVVVDLIEEPFQEDGKLRRIDGGPGELCFHARGVKVVFLQDGNNLPGRQGVASCLDAGRFQVS